MTSMVMDGIAFTMRRLLNTEGDSSQSETSAANENPEADSFVLHFAIVLLLFLLFCAYLIANFLHKKHIHWIPEAGASLLIGVGVGFLIHYLSPNGSFEKMVTFKEELFFLIFLPPIIFESGYNMKRRKFFANIFPIMMIAMLGTAISTAVIGTLVYMIGQIGLVHNPLGVLESFVFGSLISATDPVTVLAIFGSLGADLNLYSLVFGESVLNDAVAIVLYKTVLIFKTEPVNAVSILFAFGSFLKIFVGSFVVGAILGLMSSIVLKFTKMRDDPDLFFLEVAMTALFPYMSWMAAEGLGLSGIVAILFCGIVMAHYTLNNLSPDAAVFTQKFYKTLAFLSESFVFIYLGMATFIFPQDPKNAGFIVLAIIIVLVSRTFNIYPNMAFVNLFRSAETKISQKFQFILWFSGLRGAIAFVLSIDSFQNFDNTSATVIFSTTIWIVIFTVLTMGGGCYSLLTKLEVLQDPATVEIPLDAKKAPRVARFVEFDRKFLKPIFTNRVAGAPHSARDGGPGDIEMGTRSEDDSSLLSTEEKENN